VSSEAKMMIATGLVLASLATLIYTFQHYTCKTVEYQNLSGSHSESVCTWKK
jgi:hypothetical protein